MKRRKFCFYFFFQGCKLFFPAKAQWLIFSLFSAQKCFKIFFFSGWNKVFLSRGRGQRFFLSRRLGFVVLREGKIVFVQREVNIFFVQREVKIVFVQREGNIFFVRRTKKIFPSRGTKTIFTSRGTKKIFTSRGTKTIFPSLRTTKPNLRDKKSLAPPEGQKTWFLHREKEDFETFLGWKQWKNE